MTVVSPPGPTTTMNSVLGKAQLIIEAFTVDDVSLSLTDLVRRTGVAKASVHRLAQELLAWGLLERAGTGYRLGLKLFEIGHRVPRQRIVRDAALPYMEDLLLATQETVHFAIRHGTEVLYLEKIVVHRGLSEQSRVAGRLPMYCTATGKMLLAHAPDELFAEVVGKGLRPLTRHTITSPAVLRGQLDKIRERGIATEWEETRLGYASTAVPVPDVDGSPIGALSVTAPTTRMNAAQVAGALRTAANGIARTLRATR
ncbi:MULTISPECIES: IclR family transcriptional regulator [Prauserella]|nr:MULTISPECIES: IclR family transcriptional regulator [Prauserella]PXY34474.1 IclR family transcriptional regulator [Prauserella coralliicola]